MDVEKALVENLVHRLEPAAHGSGYVWNGIITERERQALRRLAGLPDDRSNTDNTPIANEGAASDPPPLDLSSQSKQLNKDLIACLDFGTAFSKAAATDPTDRLVEVGLGLAAGEPSLVYPVHSTLFIEGGRLWFGPQAMARSATLEDQSRRRFDSPKQEISQGVLDDLYSRTVGPDVNPSSVRFSPGDLILLFLGYLTSLMNEQLSARGYEDLVPRRFARPCWAEDRAVVAANTFRDMLAKAQILADTFHGVWSVGLPVDHARKKLDEVNQVLDLRTDFVMEDVLEATAAASGALKEMKGRLLVLVVDIGAGTSDFGLYCVINGQRVAEIKGTTQVLRQAGERLDELVLLALLRAAHIDPSSSEGKRIRYVLQRDIRSQKERLFEAGRVAVTLPNDSSATVTLDDFVAREDVKDFVNAFARKLEESLAGATLGTYTMTYGYVDVVLTGGGANLPMIREVFSRALQLGQHGTIHFRIRDETPEWLYRYPESEPIFGQVAVAIGGAQTELPSQLQAVNNLSMGPAGTPVILPVYKGS